MQAHHQKTATEELPDQKNVFFLIVLSNKEECFVLSENIVGLVKVRSWMLLTLVYFMLYLTY